jgi:protease II
VGQEPLLLGIEEDSYALEFGEQGPFNSSVLRVTYSSLITPESTFDVNLVTGKHLLCLTSTGAVEKQRAVCQPL